MNIQKYLYHGLGYDQDNISTIENIFQTGCIMTRNTLKKILSEEEWELFQEQHSTNWNGLDAVSIACYIENQELIETYNITLPKEEKENAYTQFIKNSIVLCLVPSILEIYSVKENTKKMGLEIQIMGDIPISYIKAIALNLSNTKKCFSTNDIFLFQKILKELKQNYLGKNFYKYYDQTFYLKYSFHEYSLDQIYEKRCHQINYIEKLRELISNYQLDIPVVDLTYGYEAPNCEVSKKRIKKLKKQYDQYLEQKKKDVNL